MSNKEGIGLTENINVGNVKLLQNIKIDGENTLKLRDYLTKENDSNLANNVFRNAYKALPFFANPDKDNQEISLSRILAIGRVQSGKTSFFIATSALAFDNGYDLVYLIGGTKNTLKEQNLLRVQEYFENNNNIKIFDINDIEEQDINSHIAQGHKLIVVILKNASENVNLGKACDLADKCSNIPTLVIDDEGDECSPGSPKLKKKGTTHRYISQIINSISKCTYLSVTATPQANFLISTIDDVSPDYSVLVEPGDGYVGGESFHDSLHNSHVEHLLDVDDFQTSIPQSFKDALNYFIFASCLQRAKGKINKYSMLVHPSSLNRVQSDVVRSMKSLIKNQKDVLSDKLNPGYMSAIDSILSHSSDYLLANGLDRLPVPIESISAEIDNVIKELSVYEFNITRNGREDVKNEKDDPSLYKIYVGGNMLGRGLTIKNLIVTYMYRDPKNPNVDTMYQMARWLGYKKSYFDVCRLYLTESLIREFVVIVDNELDMWKTLENFLLTNINIKEFPRLFSLCDKTGKMRLTRASITKQVVVERILSGFNSEDSVWWNESGKENNKKLYNSYLELHKNDSYEQSFSNNDQQDHRIIDTTFSEFYDNFLSKYSFQLNSKMSLNGFIKILEQMRKNNVDEKIKIIIMSYKHNRYRSVDLSGKAVKALLQGYDNGTGYKGDKYLTGYDNIRYFQIHPVYCDKSNKNDIMPLLAFNNPITAGEIEGFQLVTGDNYYGNSI